MVYKSSSPDIEGLSDFEYEETIDCLPEPETEGPPRVDPPTDFQDDPPIQDDPQIQDDQDTGMEIEHECQPENPAVCRPL